MGHPAPTADHYDRLPKGTVEMPNDPKPTNADAISARAKAIAEGRLKAPPRDETEQRKESGLSSPAGPTPGPFAFRFELMTLAAGVESLAKRVAALEAIAAAPIDFARPGPVLGSPVYAEEPYVEESTPPKTEAAEGT